MLSNLATNVSDSVTEFMLRRVRIILLLPRLRGRAKWYQRLEKNLGFRKSDKSKQRYQCFLPSMI